MTVRVDSAPPMQPMPDFPGAPDAAVEPDTAVEPDAWPQEPGTDTQITLDLPPFDFREEPGLANTAPLPIVTAPILTAPTAGPPTAGPSTSEGPTVARPRWHRLPEPPTADDSDGLSPTPRRADALDGVDGRRFTAAALTVAAVTVGFVTGLGVSVGMAQRAQRSYEAAERTLQMIRLEQDQLAAERADLDARQAQVDRRAADIARRQHGLAVQDEYGTRSQVELDGGSAPPPRSPRSGRQTAPDLTPGPQDAPADLLTAPAPRHAAPPPGERSQQHYDGLSGAYLAGAAPAGTYLDADGGVFFATCDDAIASGVAPLRAGSPGYRLGLDPDADGVACVW